MQKRDTSNRQSNETQRESIKKEQLENDLWKKKVSFFKKINSKNKFWCMGLFLLIAWQEGLHMLKEMKRTGQIL